MYYVINIIYVVHLFCVWDMWIDEIMKWNWKGDKKLKFCIQAVINENMQISLNLQGEIKPNIAQYKIIDTLGYTKLEPPKKD